MRSPGAAAGSHRAGTARALALGAAVAAALGGCHPRVPPPDLALDPAALLAQVRAAEGRVRSVSGRARLQVDGPDGGAGLDAFLAAERPGQLRVEAHDFFGDVVSVLAVDGGRLALYDARARAFYRGAANARNLARLVPVGLPPEALAGILCGAPPLLDGAPVSAVPGDGRVILTLRAGALEQRLEIGPGAAVLAARLRRDGGPSPDDLDVSLAGWGPAGGAALPREVLLRAPSAGVTLTLRWKEVAVNGPADPELFRLDAPAGARAVDLDLAGP